MNSAPAPVTAWPLRLAVRAALVSLVLLALSAATGAAAARADSAPDQWQPTSADLVRTVRSCPMAVSAPTAPVCWSMTEDTSAWMAQPPGSPYPWGQCTYYVGLMRPDIWNDRAPPSVDPLDNWDAWTWVQHAQAEGLSVDGNPQAGDVIVWSRAAVGNDTGHVAIVDSVGGTDPSTGDLLVTVSEMNVEGLDDASQGQGDTMTLLLPRSQLVPGMIQFIHRPGPGYTPPAWPAGSDETDPTTTAPAASPLEDPSLAVGLSSDHLSDVTESSSPVQATITSDTTGQVIEQLTVPANQSVALDLPTGSYRACATQAQAGLWAAADTCAEASWQVPPVHVTVRVVRIHARGRHLRFAVVLGPQDALARTVASAPLIAHIRVAARTVTPSRRRRGLRAVAARLVYTRVAHLHTMTQRLSMPLTGSTLRHCVITVTIAALRTDSAATSAAHVSVAFR
jgi:surface antigen